ncbi:hypothetical protein CK203_019783 [Vitis vinifera]|uniref:Retrotransposon gag domain-containing protein n=1 Tax=Vitis vinifera TaxID=29760 RepID=A0A438JQK3_VITVI|nr:hypothetical protein CK203_019783 [Vitis vinifera]
MTACCMTTLSLAYKPSKGEKQRKPKRSKEKQGGKQRTAAAVFFGTFGALTEVHFLHAIYHFKAQEVKNPTLQTVYDLELKRGRYSLRKTTALEDERLNFWFLGVMEARNPLGTRGSACVEVMTTLHGSTPSPWRRAEGCIPSEGEFIVTSLDSPSWIRVGGRLTRASNQSDQRSDQRDMDSQVVTVDQFAATMTSIQEAIANLGQKIDGQQAQQVPVQEDTLFDTTVPPPPPHSQPATQIVPFTLHKAETDEDFRGSYYLGDFDGTPVASLPAKFRMPKIERYTGIGCPRIHLRLYNTVMRAHGLDEAQMVMLFPMSLSGAAQRWFASLEVSCRRTWDDLAQEFLRQFAFNTVIDVSRRELEALRQRPEESVTSFISRWREKISQIIDRSSEKDQIRKEAFRRQRSGDVGAISSAGMRPPRRYQQLGRLLSSTIHHHLMRITGLLPIYSTPAPQTTTYVQRPPRQFAQLGLDRPGFGQLGAASVTTNPLPAHSTHAVPPSSGDIHHMDLIEDATPAPFSLILDEAPFQLTHPTPLVIGYQDAFVPFTLWPEDDDSEGERREDDEVLRQLQSTQTRISIWSLLASSSTHRDALIRALSQIRVETTTTPERLIHMMTASGPLALHRVPSVLLDNGSALNVCPLAIAIALGFAPSDFGPSTQTVRAYDTPRGRLWYLMIDLQIGPAIFPLCSSAVYQGHISAFEPVLQISHSEDDLLLTGFTFDEIQTLEIEDFCRDFVAMTTLAGTSEFIAAIDHDTTFGLGFIPTEADYCYMALLRKERVRARLSHTPFDYPIRPYRMSLADYFIRGSETRPRLEEIDSVVHIDRETDLQHLFHQLQLSDGAPDTSLPRRLLPLVPHDEYRDEMDMMTMSQITSIIQLQPVSAFDMFGVSTIEIFDIDDEIAQPVQIETLLIMTRSHRYERDRLIHLLRSYLDVFAWSYEDMPGLDPSIVQHHLPTLPHARPVKQKLRRLHPRWSLQILMAPEDMEKTTFITEWGTYCYRVMPFGLKNAGATYQRAATTLFHDMMHRDVELAFEKIKEYLLSPPVLVPPTPGRPLLLYLSVSDMALGSLVWATRRLRHYMTEYSVHLISRLDPLRYLFDRPALTGRLMRWLVLLTEFDIQYVSQKSIKGSIVTDYLASLPTSEDRPVDDDFPDEEFVAMTSLLGWCMYFDGAANQSGYGIGVLLVSLRVIIFEIEVFGDSNLVLRQIQGDWKTRDVKLRHITPIWSCCYFSFSMDIPIDVVVRPLLIELRSAPAYCCLIRETEVQDDLPWYHDIYQFLRSSTYLRSSLCRSVMREVHSGVYGPHMGGHMLARKIMRTGYFWLTMETNCCQFIQKYPECQIHGDLIHAPPSELHALTSPWPFSVWGIDIIGRYHQNLLVVMSSSWLP